MPLLAKVVLNRATWYTFTQSQAKPKLPFPQYPFLTVFFNQKRALRNENLGLSNLVHFYTILDTSVRFPYTIIRSWTLPYDPHTNEPMNLPTSIKACPLNVFKLLEYKYLRKKMNRKQCWNMWILEYLLNFLPQVIYHHILKRLNKALYWFNICGSPCDSHKQRGWGSVSNLGVKPCIPQGRTVNSQEDLDKSRLVEHPVVPDG